MSRVIEKHLLESILDTLYDGVYSVDLDCRMTYWNQAASKMAGFSPDEVIGKCCSEKILLHVDERGVDLCSTGCPLKAAMRDGQPREANLFLHHKNGHRVPVKVRCTPVRDEQGKIIGGVEVFNESVAEETMREKMQQLEQMAYVDALTQVFNRRYMEALLRQRCDELSRYGWPFGVIIFDVDHFKKINDQHGHNIGDDVLKMVARTLSSNARSFDSVGRWGGEEFLVILSNVFFQLLQRIAERFRMLVQKSYLNHNGTMLKATISGGAAMALKNEPPEALLARADRMLYQSKNSGRNRLFVDQSI